MENYKSNYKRNLLRLWRAKLVHALVGAALAGCASAPVRVPLATPTPDNPRVGCILPTTKQGALVEGKIQPEKVYWIGVTSIDDGERLMIIRPSFDEKEWIPMERGAVVFDGRCRLGPSLFEAGSTP